MINNLAGTSFTKTFITKKVRYFTKNAQTATINCLPVYLPNLWKHRAHVVRVHDIDLSLYDDVVRIRRQIANMEPFLLARNET